MIQNIKKILIIAMLSLSVIDSASAQEGVVVVNAFTPLVTEASTYNHKVRGYSVRIFADNSQTARSKSNEIASDFKNSYLNVPVDVSYESPYFKVTVGKFLTKEEAIMLWGGLLSKYPTAYVVPITVEIGEFATMPKPSLSPITEGGNLSTDTKTDTE